MLALIFVLSGNCERVMTIEWVCIVDKVDSESKIEVRKHFEKFDL